MKIERTALYRCYDNEKNLLYIGISLSAINRLSQHNRYSKWFEKIAKVDIEWFENRESAIFAEMESVRIEQPKFNVFLKHRKISTQRIRKVCKQRFYKILATKNNSEMVGGVEMSGDEIGEPFLCLTPETFLCMGKGKHAVNSFIEYLSIFEDIDAGVGISKVYFCSRWPGGSYRSEDCDVLRV